MHCCKQRTCITNTYMGITIYIPPLYLHTHGNRHSPDPKRRNRLPRWGGWGERRATEAMSNLLSLLYTILTEKVLFFYILSQRACIMNKLPEGKVYLSFSCSADFNLSYTSTCEPPTLLYTWTLRKDSLSDGASPCRPLLGVTPRIVCKQSALLIVNRGEWLWNSTKLFVVCFVLFLSLDSAQNTIVVYSVLRIKPIETCWLGNSVKVYESKTKDYSPSWTFQHKSWRLCLLLWCLPGLITSLLY